MQQLQDIEIPDLSALPPFLREGSACVACGGTVDLETRGGVWFCADCIAWTRQGNLDPLYDDLGVGD